MPKTPIDWSRTVIYKLICDDQQDFLYVGSTTDFTKRKYQHKAACTNETYKSYNLKVYQQIRGICGGWENITMVEIERFTECIDGNDSRKREQFWIDELKANANSIKLKGNKATTEQNLNKDDRNKNQMKKHHRHHKKYHRHHHMMKH